MGKKLSEMFTPRPADSRLGRFGAVGSKNPPRGTITRGDYNGGAGDLNQKASSFPYIEVDDDTEADDDVISTDMVDKIQSKMGGMKFKHDYGAKDRSVSLGGGNNRSFTGHVAESLPSVQGSTRKSGSTSIAPFSSNTLYPNMGPSAGGTGSSSSIYRTGPGFSRGTASGTLKGYSKPPKDTTDDNVRVFRLKDMPTSDEKALSKIRKIIRDILLKGKQ